MCVCACVVNVLVLVSASQFSCECQCWGEMWEDMVVVLLCGGCGGSGTRCCLWCVLCGVCTASRQAGRQTRGAWMSVCGEFKNHSPIMGTCTHEELSMMCLSSSCAHFSQSAEDLWLLWCGGVVVWWCCARCGVLRVVVCAGCVVCAVCSRDGQVETDTTLHKTAPQHTNHTTQNPSTSTKTQTQTQSDAFLFSSGSREI